MDQDEWYSYLTELENFSGRHTARACTETNELENTQIISVYKPVDQAYSILGVYNDWSLETSLV